MYFCSSLTLRTNKYKYLLLIKKIIVPKPSAWSGIVLNFDDRRIRLVGMLMSIISPTVFFRAPARCAIYTKQCTA